MVNKTDLIDGGLICTGLGISLVDLQNILSIIILIIDILWIALKVTIKLFRYLKDGKLTDEELQDLENDVNKIIGKEDDPDE